MKAIEKHINAQYFLKQTRGTVDVWPKIIFSSIDTPSGVLKNPRNVSKYEFDGLER